MTLERETPQSCHGGHREKAALRKPERELSQKLSRWTRVCDLLLQNLNLYALSRPVGGAL